MQASCSGDAKRDPCGVPGRGVSGIGAPGDRGEACCPGGTTPALPQSQLICSGALPTVGEAAVFVRASEMRAPNQPFVPAAVLPSVRTVGDIAGGHAEG